jgi:hypothetical protein
LHGTKMQKFQADRALWRFLWLSEFLTREQIWVGCLLAWIVTGNLTIYRRLGKSNLWFNLFTPGSQAVTASHLRVGNVTVDSPNYLKSVRWGWKSSPPRGISIHYKYEANKLRWDTYRSRTRPR